MKTKIKFTSTDQYNEWNIGDTGFVDGYTRNYDGDNYAVVVLDKNGKFVLSKLYHLQKISTENES